MLAMGTYNHVYQHTYLQPCTITHIRMHAVARARTHTCAHNLTCMYTVHTGIHVANCGNQHNSVATYYGTYACCVPLEFVGGKRYCNVRAWRGMWCGPPCKTQKAHPEHAMGITREAMANITVWHTATLFMQVSVCACSMHTHTIEYTHTHTCSYTTTHTHTHIAIMAYTHTCMHASSRTYIRTPTHAHTHTYTCIRTLVHTCTRTNIVGGMFAYMQATTHTHSPTCMHVCTPPPRT